jgi:hypothetical protein
MTLNDIRDNWHDSQQAHRLLNQVFISAVNDIPTLKAHRDFVENNIWGFGERSFHWMHKLIVDEMPQSFSFLEIGVFKGQVLSLYQLLADMAGKTVFRYGVTPLSTAGGVWESDYRKDIEVIHDQLDLSKGYTILEGFSTDPAIICQAQQLQIDVLYIDGGHDYKTVINDFTHYLSILKRGGILVVDDCCNNMNLPNGYFAGHKEVTDATNFIMAGNQDYEFLFNVVHNKVWRKLN